VIWHAVQLYVPLGDLSRVVVAAKRSRFHAKREEGKRRGDNTAG
jgi:hypothetical protein